MKKLQLFSRYPRRQLFYWFLFAVLIHLLFVFSHSNRSYKPYENKISEIDGLKVPEGFSIERAAAPGMLTYPMFASFDGKGRLFVFESDGSSPSTEDMLKKPPYHIRLLED
ncbi:MAG: hypothetical protein WKF70_12270, partial [Chitinophagaceae bacterium]